LLLLRRSSSRLLVHRLELSLDGVDSPYALVLAANRSIAGKLYDDAVAGAKVGDIATQAQEAVAQQAQYVTILIGANDVCTSSVSTMTPTSTFQSQGVVAVVPAGFPTQRDGYNRVIRLIGPIAVVHLGQGIRTGQRGPWPA
jgi:lysophospholipase L1-like esterase